MILRFWKTSPMRTPLPPKLTGNIRTPSSSAKWKNNRKFEAIPRLRAIDFVMVTFYIPPKACREGHWRLWILVNKLQSDSRKRLQSKHSWRPAVCLELHVAQSRGCWGTDENALYEEKTHRAFSSALQNSHDFFYGTTHSFKREGWKIEDRQRDVEQKRWVHDQADDE